MRSSAPASGYVENGDMVTYFVLRRLGYRPDSAWSKPSGFKPPSGDGGTGGGATRGTAELPVFPSQQIEPLSRSRTIDSLGPFVVRCCTRCRPSLLRFPNTSFHCVKFVPVVCDTTFPESELSIGCPGRVLNRTPSTEGFAVPNRVVHHF